MNAIIEFGIAVLVPVGKSVVGWTKQYYLSDGVVSDWEWKKLGETILGVGVPATIAWLGFNAAGIDFSAISAAAVGYFFDKMMSLKKKKEKKR